MNVRTTIRESAVKAFEASFAERLKLDEPLARYTSARVGGPAQLFLAVHSAAELETAVTIAYNKRVPYTLLGGGSNILVSAYGVSGLVIMNKARNINFRHTGAGVICTVESGMNLSSLARQCIGKGLGGLE